MKRFKVFVDFDKEENWLNRLAAEGQLLTRVGAGYTFAPVAPGSAVVRIDYRPSMNRLGFDGYRARLASLGWRHLGGSRWGGRQYFASFTNDPEADMFTDTAAKAQRYRRSIADRVPLLMALVPIFVVLWMQGTVGLSSFSSPAGWYLTPGLWDQHGVHFLVAFLIETPFVLLRVGAPLLFIGYCLVQLGQLAYHYVLYRRRIARPAM